MIEAQIKRVGWKFDSFANDGDGRDDDSIQLRRARLRDSGCDTKCQKPTKQESSQVLQRGLSELAARALWNLVSSRSQLEPMPGYAPLLPGPTLGFCRVALRTGSWIVMVPARS